MPKEELLEFPGVISELLPNAIFRVKLDNEHEIIAHTAGRMRKNRTRIVSVDLPATKFWSRRRHTI
jgi:translation initiation factor IF-1